MIKFILLLAFVMFPNCVFASSVSSTFNVEVEINNCNNNAVCEDLIGENFPTCSSDCPAVCIVNGTCESLIGESLANCAADCAPVSTTTTSTVPVVVSSGGGGGGNVASEVVFNVTNLAAQAGDSVVVLSWEVFDQSSYGGVLIRRSDISIPNSIYDGGILYNGLGEQNGINSYILKDLNLQNGKWYFYTIFLYNKSGKFASGASISALPQDKNMKDGLIDLIIPPKKLPAELSLPKKYSTSTNQYLPKVSIIQDSTLILPKEFTQNVYILKPFVTTTILIDKNTVPENIKRITATIDNGRKFQTLFFEKDILGNYILNIPSGVITKDNKVTFTVINNENQVLSQVETILNTPADSVLTTKTTAYSNKFINYIYKNTTIFFQPILEIVTNTVVAIIKLSVQVIRLLRYWFYILGTLVIHN